MCTHDDEPVSGELPWLGPVDELGDRSNSTAFAVTRSSVGPKTKRELAKGLKACAHASYMYSALDKSSFLSTDLWCVHKNICDPRIQEQQTIYATT